MHSIGIMQGRLVSPKGRGIQFFPFEEWEAEFESAKKTGIDEIEFIFDFDRYEENPLWSDGGIKKLKAASAGSGVKVNHICADFFMRRPFFRVTENERAENIAILNKLVAAAKTIAAKTIEIPLVDNSSMKTPEETALFVTALKNCLPEAEKNGLRIGLETDLAPAATVALLKMIDSPIVHITYDSGNSASFGHNCKEEMAAYADRIGNVHIKDRAVLGAEVKSVTLGTGGADFPALFSSLTGVNYKGSFVLQAARGEEGKEAANIAEQRKFVEDYLKRYFI